MNTALAERLGIVPIDAAAHDGRTQLVFAGGRYALVRWTEERWQFPSGQPWRLTPTHYKPRED
jgi:hypothetical protein